ETGFDVVDVTYVASQPWVLSGSLMVGFSAVATYESLIHPGPRDGELIEVRWVGKTELEDVNLPGSGSIAHKLLKEWYSRSEEHTSELQSRFELVCRLLLEK